MAKRNPDWDKDRYIGHEDKRGKFRWRLTAANGAIVGASTQGYASKADCTDNARRNGCTQRQVCYAAYGEG